MQGREREIEPGGHGEMGGGKEERERPLDSGASRTEERRAPLSSHQPDTWAAGTQPSHDLLKSDPATPRFPFLFHLQS